MIAVWPFTDPLYPLISSTGAPVDQLASFQPDIGPAITRPRTTAQIESWDVNIILRSYEDLDTFEAWFRGDLAFGSKPFLWVHPTEKDLRRVKFRGGSYGKSFAGAGITRLSLPVLILPGLPDNLPHIPWAWWL